MPDANSQTYNVIRNLAPTKSGSIAAAHQAALFAFHTLLQSALIEGGWTLEGSSDGTTGALDGVDRIPTASEWVRSSGASAETTPHSWAVYSKEGLAQVTASNPTGKAVLMIDNRTTSATSTNGQIRIQLGTDLPVLAATPTHSPGDLPGYCTPPGTNASCAHVPSASVAYNFHMSRAANGEFHIFYGDRGFFAVRKLSSPHAADVSHGLWLACGYNASNPASSSTQIGINAANDSTGMSAVRSVTDGSSQWALTPGLGAYSANSSAGHLGQLFTGGDTALPNTPWWKIPWTIWQPGSMAGQYRGHIADCYYVSQSMGLWQMNNGDGGDATAVHIGSGVLIPWDSNLVPATS